MGSYFSQIEIQNFPGWDFWENVRLIIFSYNDKLIAQQKGGIYGDNVSGNVDIHHTSCTCSSGGRMHISNASTSRYHNVDIAGRWGIQFNKVFEK